MPLHESSGEQVRGLQLPVLPAENAPEKNVDHQGKGTLGVEKTRVFHRRCSERPQ